MRETINIHMHHITVPVYFEDAATFEPPDGDKDATGYYDSKRETIHILAEGMAESAIADTVLHEVLHMVYNQGGGEPEKKKTEEAFVCSLTSGLKQLLVLDNDELFDYLGVNL